MSSAEKETFVKNVSFLYIAHMSKALELLKKFFKKTPKEEVENMLKEGSDIGLNGPSIEEFLTFTNPHRQYKVGDKVNYKTENGIIKSIDETTGVIFVVYKCNNDWNNYKDYTGQNTPVKDLKKGWKKIGYDTYLAQDRR